MRLFFLLLILQAFESVSAQPLSHLYFGQTPPDSTPKLFAPEELMKPGGLFAITRIAFSPDGKECFFSGPIDRSYTGTRMYNTKFENNKWSKHEIVSFFQGNSCRQPYFSADGNTLYFSSNKNGTSDIWKVDRTSHGWGTPQVLSEPVNSSSYDGKYNVIKDGTIYFESNRSGGLGGTDIWCLLSKKNKKEAELINLSKTINSSSDDVDPTVAPDGKYMIFSRNYDDLYVAFRTRKKWSSPINMNQIYPGINTQEQEYAPTISPDGKYLFFTRVADGGLHWVSTKYINKKRAVQINTK